MKEAHSFAQLDWQWMMLERAAKHRLGAKQRDYGCSLMRRVQKLGTATLVSGFTWLKSHIKQVMVQMSKKLKRCYVICRKMNKPTKTATNGRN